MSPSPFHGIFSALGAGSAKDAFPWDTSASALPERGDGATDPSVGRVAVDVFDHENFVIIKAPIAGCRMADIDIEVNERVVTIRGTRRQADAAGTDQYYVKECFWGPFARSVTLPFAVDPRKIKATFNKECILKIYIPKEEKAKSVRIEEA